MPGHAQVCCPAGTVEAMTGRTRVIGSAAAVAAMTGLVLLVAHPDPRLGGLAPVAPVGAPRRDAADGRAVDGVRGRRLAGPPGPAARGGRADPGGWNRRPARGAVG